MFTYPLSAFIINHSFLTYYFSLYPEKRPGHEEGGDSSFKLAETFNPSPLKL